jgi:hypothetical protein
MLKVDFKAQTPQLYNPPVKEAVLLEVPPM